MDMFLLFLFAILGVAGLVYQVDAGVFVGLGLVPWQLIKLKISKKISLITIIITLLAGSVYFISTSKWLLFFLFLLIEVYDYWGYSNTEVD